MNRFYESVVKDHFNNNKQMAFVCGPRQVGKTTLAKNLQHHYTHSLYYTWDAPQDRMCFMETSYEPLLKKIPLSPAIHPLLILDEIHKYPDWKNYLKGLYDIYNDQLDILITGSARLNIFYKGGDSLMGRYFLYRVHPLTIAENIHRSFELFQSPHFISQDKIEQLWEFGGFPEPFSKSNKRFFNKWQHLRHQQLIYEDIRSLEAIQNLSQLELLATLLAYHSGQLINYTNLASKVKVSVPTLQRWLSVLEQVYYCYRIRPWSNNISRSLLKEPKIYLYDWSLVQDVGARYENLVASHLLKAIHFWTDSGLGVFDLYFIRTKDQKEVDFLVTKDTKPWMLIEAKMSSKASLSSSLYDFQKKLMCPFAFQVVFDLPSNEKALAWLSENVLDKNEAPAVILPFSSLFSLMV